MGKRERERKARRRMLPSEALLKVQTAPSVAVNVGTGRRETTQDRYQQFLAEERAAEEQKLAPLVEANVIALRQLDSAIRDMVKRYWSQPRWTKSLTAEDCQKLESEAEFAVDDNLQVPEGKPTVEKCLEVGEQWFDSLTARTGMSLNPAGLTRVVTYAITQMRLRGRDFSTVAAFDTAARRLQDCGAFQDGEFAQDLSLITIREPEVIVPEVKPSVDEIIERESSESREGRKKILEALEDGWTNEVRVVWQAWLAHLSKDHQFIPNDTQKKAAYNFFRKGNLSMTDMRNFDRCRVALSKGRIFPDIRTPQELEMDRIENEVSTMTMSHAQRQDLAARLNQFHKPEEVI